MNAPWDAVQDHTVEQRVLECLQRSLKLADNCMPQAQFPLFVEILNKYLYHFNHENEKVCFSTAHGKRFLVGWGDT